MKLNIKRSLLGAYEEERAEPRIDVLELVSDQFGISLDELLRKDLGEMSGSYLVRRREQKMASAGTQIQFVPVKAAAGYLTGYADQEFIDELNTFTLPMLGAGHFRAFEIVGDSMLPTPSGSIIVGEKVEGADQIRDNQAYIVVSKSEGIVYKRVVRNQRVGKKLTLVSDNPVFQPYTVAAEDILELWQAQMVITKVSNAHPTWDMHQLASLVSNLQEQVSTLKKQMN